MKITNVNVNKIEKEDSKVKGYATVIIDDTIAIHNIRIIDGNNGLFVAMPSKKGDDEKYYDIVHPITNDIRNQIYEVIINAYKGVK